MAASLHSQITGLMHPGDISQNPPVDAVLNELARVKEQAASFLRFLRIYHIRFQTWR